MRLIGSALVGWSIAVVLFLLMSQLIAGDNDQVNRDASTLNLNFIRLNLDEIENIRRRVAPMLPEPVQPPDAPPLIVDYKPTESLEAFAEIDTSPFSVELDLRSGIGMGRFTGGISLGDLSEDGDLYPILQVTPIYPAAARLAKQFGWVDLQYTVLTDGTVVDAVVVNSRVNDPNESVTVTGRRPAQDIFNQAAIDAALRTRYKPRVVNGEPVPVRVTQRFAFNVVN
jgi:protein TonB